MNSIEVNLKINTEHHAILNSRDGKWHSDLKGKKNSKELPLKRKKKFKFWDAFNLFELLVILASVPLVFRFLFANIFHLSFLKYCQDLRAKWHIDDLRRIAARFLENLTTTKL